MTGRRTSDVEVQMAEMKTDIKYIKESLDDNKEQHAELKEMFESWMNESKSRFSGKWVERAMIGAITIAAGTIIPFMIYKIFNL
jgi:hypothetical protein